jgi:hypothetical protein
MAALLKDKNQIQTDLKRRNAAILVSFRSLFLVHFHFIKTQNYDNL